VSHWILHVDLDQFQAAVEVRRNPELAGLPVIVGGNGDPTEPRKVVTCASYPAREFGVHAGMPLRTAARKCPDAVFLPLDTQAYDEASEEVMTLLRDFGHPVEVWGWDEAYVGADLNSRFALSFTAVGLVVGMFGVGGLIYAGAVQQFVNGFGQRGLALGGGMLLCAAYLTLATGAAWWLAPFATTMIGLGFYCLHNTLQTNATQMTPQARGTAVAIFSSAIYLGQTAGVGAGALVFDRYGAVPLLLVAAFGLVTLGWWFARKLGVEMKAAG